MLPASPTTKTNDDRSSRRPLAPLQGGHGQPGIGELLPVQLRGLAMPAPDEGLAGVVDAVGERVSGRDVDPGDRAGQRDGDMVEGVVVVVADDHTPGAAQPALGSGGPRPLDGLRHASRYSGSSTARGPSTAARAAWRAPSRRPRSPRPR